MSDLTNRVNEAWCERIKRSFECDTVSVRQWVDPSTGDVHLWFDCESWSAPDIEFTKLLNLSNFFGTQHIDVMHFELRTDESLPESHVGYQTRLFTVNVFIQDKKETDDHTWLKN